MRKDPIVEEIHKARANIMAEHGNNPKKLYEHIQKMQNGHKTRLASFSPKFLTKRKTA